MVVEFIQKTRCIITKHQEAYEDYPEYLLITQKFDKLVDSLYENDPKKRKSKNDLKEMAEVLLCEFYAFEANYRRNRFNAKKIAKDKEIKNTVDYEQKIGSATFKKKLAIFFILIFIFLSLDSVFSSISSWFFSVLFLVGIFIFHKETL